MTRIAEDTFGHNSDKIDARLTQATTDLRGYIALSSPSTAQTVAVVKLLCLLAIGLIRLRTGRLDGTD